jgi:hypothetical protein
LYFRCIPEESNEIGTRTQRSQETTPSASASGAASFLPNNWELLAIGALAAAIIILVIFSVSLGRHVRRLKARLRHSAEVLVPSNGVVGNGTLLNHAGVHHVRHHQNGTSAAAAASVTTPMISTST